MSENTDLSEENLPKPENTASLNPLPVAGAITEINVPETSPGQKTKDMEVHHHGHVHEKKKWKEYVFQFIMLLAAVFLGSYAETKREELTERHKERDYIVSMIGDITKDSPEIGFRHSFIFSQIQKIDSIQALFTHDLKNNEAEVATCYELSMYLPYYATVIFNETAISQLLSTGNMRLIKRNGAADSIMGYYNAIKTIEQQKQQYIDYINLAYRAMFKVYDVSYLNMGLNLADTTLMFTKKDWVGINLLTYDPAVLKELSATLETTNLVLYSYMYQLGDIAKKADRLVSFLRKEYDIKENEE